MPTGRTRDAGWQIGVSRTVDHPPDHVWDVLSSPEGAALWLGEGARLEAERGAPWSADDGAAGEVRSFRPGDRIRVTCRPSGSDHETTVQLAIVPVSGDRASIRLHQERLRDAQERQRQRTHWQRVMDRLEDALDSATLDDA
jgi:uncharacterized protein YndB with AHSA1/START domain